MVKRRTRSRRRRKQRGGETCPEKEKKLLQRKAAKQCGEWQSGERESGWDGVTQWEPDEITQEQLCHIDLYDDYKKGSDEKVCRDEPSVETQVGEQGRTQYNNWWQVERDPAHDLLEQSRVEYARDASGAMPNAFFVENYFCNNPDLKKHQLAAATCKRGGRRRRRRKSRKSRRRRTKKRRKSRKSRRRRTKKRRKSRRRR